jgi:chromosome segregation ATPase
MLGAASELTGRLHMLQHGLMDTEEGSDEISAELDASRERIHVLEASEMALQCQVSMLTEQLRKSGAVKDTCGGEDCALVKDLQRDLQEARSRIETLLAAQEDITPRAALPTSPRIVVDPTNLLGHYKRDIAAAHRVLMDVKCEILSSQEVSIARVMGLRDEIANAERQIAVLQRLRDSLEGDVRTLASRVTPSEEAHVRYDIMRAEQHARPNSIN